MHERHPLLGERQKQRDRDTERETERERKTHRPLTGI